MQVLQAECYSFSSADRIAALANFEMLMSISAICLPQSHIFFAVSGSTSDAVSSDTGAPTISRQAVALWPFAA